MIQNAIICVIHLCVCVCVTVVEERGNKEYHKKNYLQEKKIRTQDTLEPKYICVKTFRT